MPLQASATGVCLTDPAVTDGVTFDLDLCPSLLKMLVGWGWVNKTNT